MAASRFATDPALQAALRQRRAWLHSIRVSSTVTMSALAGAGLLALAWPQAGLAASLLWAGALAGALLVRALVSRACLRADPTPMQAAPWLLRHRLSYALHGLVWCGAAFGLAWPQAPLAPDPLALAVAVAAGGGLITVAFDLTAAVCFALPALLAVVLRLVAGEAYQQPLLGLLGLLLLAGLVMAARRTTYALLATLRLERAEAERSEEARRHADAADAARRELQVQNRLLTQLVHTTPQGCWFASNEGITTDVNPAMCQLLGRPREALIGRHVLDFFSGGDLKTMREQLAARGRGESGEYEAGIVRPDGSRCYCHAAATPLFDAEGRPAGLVAFWTDLTEHLQVTARLRLYEVVANSITDPVSVLGEDLQYRMVNDAWCRTTGLRREHALGRSVRDIMPAVGTEARRQAMRDCFQLNQVRVHRAPVRLPGLPQKVLETTYFPYGADADGVRCAVVVSRDVTDQEVGRQAMADSAEYLRRTLNATGDAIFATDATDPDQPVRFVNAQMLALWGIPAELGERLSPRLILDHAMPLFADPEGELARVREILDSRRSDTWRLHLRDGRVLLRRCEQADLGGRMLRVWSFRDITAETQALSLLQAREAEQRALLDAFPGFIARIDSELRYTYVNQGLADLLGSTPEQVVGRAVAEMTTARQLAVITDIAQRTLDGEPGQFDRHYPARPDAQGGLAALTVQYTTALGTDPRSGQPAVYAFGIDITPLKQAQAALQAAGGTG